MADAVITALVDRLAAIVEDKIHYEVNLVRGVKKEILDVSDKLETIRSVLDDAENKGAKEQSVKNWLKKLEDITYEIDDVLDEWDYALHKHNAEDSAEQKEKVCCSFIPSPLLCLKKLPAQRDTALKIQNVKATLDKVLKEKDDFGFDISKPQTEVVPKSLRVQSTSSIELEKVCGWDIYSNKDDIVSKLLLSSHSQILSIVGMGGLGKTTLAQLAYNDGQVEKCFQLRIWICVSDPFDVAGIAGGIVASIGTHSIPSNTNHLELLLQKLRDSISGKKFLLVLDDVWTEKSEEWEPLKNILKCGAAGSKIIVTTRKEGTTKMMGTLDGDIYRPKHLTGNECWSLLSDIALLERSEAECRELEDVGKKIASKCNGLPLAAKVLGSLLQCKKSLKEWESVLESEIWNLEEAEVDLFPHLLLSYNELSPALKRCFSYCAVYPKDSQVHVESMIEEWIALGYLGPVTGNGKMEAIGQKYFHSLAMRSLFQEFKRKNDEFSEEIESCKMHDIVHAFAKFLRKRNDRLLEAPGIAMKTCKIVHDPLLLSQVQEYRSLFWDKATPPKFCDCLSSLRVVKFKGKLNGAPHGMEKLIHLRSLGLSGTKLSKEDLKIICRLYFLQTLLLQSCSLEEIPDEIGNLVRLRHLNLEENRELKELPESICSLVELEILNIEHCWKLRGLPEGIHKLENLQHLLILNTHVRECFPQGLAQLSGLRTLNAFWGGSNYNKLGMLKNLNRLSGSLFMEIWIRSIGDLEDLVEDAREAGLRNKMHIQRLELRFINGSDVKEWSSLSSLWMDVIEALEPHQNLKKLNVWGYEGSRLPLWISSPLNLTKEITLMGFGELTSLPPLGKLPFLELLVMHNMSALEVVGREFLGIECSSSSSSSSTNGPVVAFPRLKKLKFLSCKKWREWEDITAEEEESDDLSVMPCLENLTVKNCVSLKKLPRLLRMAYSLHGVYIGVNID